MTHMSGSIGIRALQQNAAAVVGKVAKGEVVEITYHGRPVATLVPARSGGLEALVRSGMARPARRRVRDLPPPLVAGPTRPSLSDLLFESRAEER